MSSSSSSSTAAIILSADDNNNNNNNNSDVITGQLLISAVIFLFMVVLFLLSLYLYAKYCMVPGRRRRRRARFVFALGDDQFPATRRGLNTEILSSLPIKIFNPSEFKDGIECAVCLSELSEGEAARILPKCNHGFHVECIDMWFHSHSTCPLCRAPVTAAADDQSEASTAESATTIPTTDVLQEEESSSSSSRLSRPAAMLLVIDIPQQRVVDIAQGEEMMKSPMSARLSRSFGRLLSRGKVVVAGDVEQGEGCSANPKTPTAK